MALKTPRLNLPYIASAQAQKHVTHNEALRTLDVLCQIAVSDVITSLPTTPSEGDCYVIGAGGQGDLADKEHDLFAFIDGAWMNYEPQLGWVSWLASDEKLMVYDGVEWVDIGGGSQAGDPFLKLGINATADDTNRLTVKSDAVLHSHDDVTPGNGSVHHKLNKAATPDNASFLFQTGFSGRAEIGLTGDDDFHFKVSPDGTSFTTAMTLDKTSGIATMHEGLTIPKANQYWPSGKAGIEMLNSDIAGVNSIYLNDSANSLTEGIAFLKSGKTAKSTDSADYDFLRVLDGKAYINSDPLGSQFYISKSGRIYFYGDGRWVTPHDESYGVGYYQHAESGGTGTDPIQEWEHMGEYVREGTRIHELAMFGRSTATLANVEDLEILISFTAPNPISKWDSTGIDGDGEDAHVELWRGFWKAGGTGVADLPALDLRDQIRRSIPIDYTTPTDGQLRFYVRPLRPTGSNTTTYYFFHSHSWLLSSSG